MKTEQQSQLKVKRMDIFKADLSTGVGSEQQGERPVLVIQNDVGNRFSPTVVVASITGQINKAKIPTHVEIGRRHGLEKDSVILLEQLRTLDKQRLIKKITHIEGPIVDQVHEGLLISLGLVKF